MILKTLIIEKVAPDEESRLDLRNISEVSWEFRRIVFSRRFQDCLDLGCNRFKLLDIDAATISFIRRLHEEGIEQASLFFGMYKFFYDQNENGLHILKQLADSGIGEAVYAYWIALLCNGQYDSGIGELQFIMEEEDGRYYLPTCRCAFKKIIGPEWFEKIPPLKFCEENTIAHWASMDPNTIKRWAEFDITCEKCIVAVELKKLAMPLGWDPDLEY